MIKRRTLPFGVVAVAVRWNPSIPYLVLYFPPQFALKIEILDFIRSSNLFNSIDLNLSTFYCSILLLILTRKFLDNKI